MISPGIIRCDMIAESVIAAAAEVPDVPVVVRLQGTNAEKGQKMVSFSPWPKLMSKFCANPIQIADCGLALFAESEFDGAVRKAIELSKRDSKQAQQSTTSEQAQSSRPLSFSPSAPAMREFSTASPFYISGRKPRSSQSASYMQTRSFTNSSRRSAAYSDSILNLAINKDTRVIYQGFLGKSVS